MRRTHSSEAASSWTAAAGGRPCRRWRGGVCVTCPGSVGCDAARRVQFVVLEHVSLFADPAEAHERAIGGGGVEVGDLLDVLVDLDARFGAAPHTEAGGGESCGIRFRRADAAAVRSASPSSGSSRVAVICAVNVAERSVCTVEVTHCSIAGRVAPSAIVRASGRARRAAAPERMRPARRSGQRPRGCA